MNINYIYLIAILIFLILKSIKFSYQLIVNLLFLLIIILSYFYINHKKKIKKKNIIQKINNNVNNEIIDNLNDNIIKYIEELIEYKEYNNTSIDEGIIYLNIFYKNIKDNDFSKANDNRKLGINTLFSVTHSINNKEIDKTYKEIVNKINNITLKDYKKYILKYNKQNIIKVNITEPIPVDKLFDNNFSLV